MKNNANMQIEMNYVDAAPTHLLTQFVIFAVESFWTLTYWIGSVPIVAEARRSVIDLWS